MANQNVVNNSETVMPQQLWTAVDYGLIPPEINSGKMYAGPGAAPLLTAAAAWDGLAAELYSAATGYTSIVTELAELRWSGPSSAAMQSAAMPFASWLSTTAATAESVAMQARAAAVAYENAFALTVPPPAVTANRVRLMTLIATNFFGQNLAAIAATEIEYAEFWAQDAAVMYTYAGSAATASTLTPLQQPPTTTNQEGLVNQQAAAGQAESTAAGSTQDWLRSFLTGAWKFLSSTANQNVFGNAYGLSYFGAGVVQLATLFTQNILPDNLTSYMAAAPAITLTGEGSAATAATVRARVTAALGQSQRIGLISTPARWASAVSPTTSTAPLATPASATGSIPAKPGPMTMPPLRQNSRDEQFTRRRYGIRHKVVPRPPGGG